MAKPRAGRKTGAKKAAAGKPAARKPAKKRALSPSPRARERESFATGLLTRGEAVPEPPPGQDLPPGATHTYDPAGARDGAPPANALRRRRFSLL